VLVLELVKRLTACILHKHQQQPSTAEVTGKVGAACSSLDRNPLRFENTASATSAMQLVNQHEIVQQHETAGSCKKDGV
jgi:spore coat protein U-like protein